MRGKQRIERVPQLSIALHVHHRPDHALVHVGNLDVEEDAVAVEQEAARARHAGQDGHPGRLEALHLLADLCGAEPHGLDEHAFNHSNLIATLLVARSALRLRQRRHCHRHDHRK